MNGLRWLAGRIAAVPPPSGQEPLRSDPQASEARSFSADVVVKRTGTWTGGKVVPLDRQPRGKRTEFKHCLRRHTIALHLEGANTCATLRYGRGPQSVTGSALGQVMLIPAEHQLEGWPTFRRGSGTYSYCSTPT